MKEARSVWKSVRQTGQVQLARTQLPAPCVIARGTEQMMEEPDPTWTFQDLELGSF